MTCSQNARREEKRPMRESRRAWEKQTKPWKSCSSAPPKAIDAIFSAFALGVSRQGWHHTGIEVVLFRHLKPNFWDHGIRFNCSPTQGTSIGRLAIDHLVQAEVPEKHRSQTSLRTNRVMSNAPCLDDCDSQAKYYFELVLQALHFSNPLP